MSFLFKENRRFYRELSEKDFDNYCKAVVFYGSLSGDTAKLTFSPARVDELKERTIKQDFLLIKFLKPGSGKTDFDYATIR